MTKSPSTSVEAENKLPSGAWDALMHTDLYLLPLVALACVRQQAVTASVAASASAGFPAVSGRRDTRPYRHISCNFAA